MDGTGWGKCLNFTLFTFSYIWENNVMVKNLSRAFNWFIRLQHPWIRKRCTYEKALWRWETLIWIFLRMYMFSVLLIMKQWFLVSRLSIRLCASLELERLDGLNPHSVLRTSSIIYRCLVNINFLAPKIRTLQMGSQKQNCDFLETTPVILTEFR
jgi:hypothetical protein